MGNGRSPGCEYSCEYNGVVRSVLFVLVGLAVSCHFQGKHLRRGQQLAQAHQFEAAVDAYLKALEDDPASADPHLGLASVYLAMQRHEEALKAAEQARRLDEGEEPLVLMAQIHYDARQYGESVSILNGVVRREPDVGLHHHLLGLAQVAGNDVRSGADSFQMAIILDPNLTASRRMLAVALKRLERYDDAVQVLKAALQFERRQGRKVPKLQLTLADVYEAMKLYDYARSTYERVVKTQPNNTDALAGLGRTMRLTQRLEEAIDVLQSAIRRHPKNGSLHHELGMAYRDFRMPPEAVEMLQKAIGLAPKEPGPYEPLLEMIEELIKKDPGQADKHFEILGKAAQAQPERLDLQIQYGKEANEREHFDQALQALQLAIDLDPSSIEANQALGLAQVGKGLLEEAMETLGTVRILDVDAASNLERTIEDARAAKAPPKKPPSNKKNKRRKKKRRRKKK